MRIYGNRSMYRHMTSRMKRIFTPETFQLRIKRSKAGRGLFSYSSIPNGACIIEYTGRPATEKQMKENTGKYLFWNTTKTMIDGNIAGNRARFINHSCVPNCEIDLKDSRVYVFATRSIRSGEELTFDYDTEYFDLHIKPLGCLCAKCSPDASSKVRLPTQNGR